MEFCKIFEIFLFTNMTKRIKKGSKRNSRDWRDNWIELFEDRLRFYYYTLHIAIHAADPALEIHAPCDIYRSAGTPFPGDPPTSLVRASPGARAASVGGDNVDSPFFLICVYSDHALWLLKNYNKWTTYKLGNGK